MPPKTESSPSLHIKITPQDTLAFISIVTNSEETDYNKWTYNIYDLNGKKVYSKIPTTYIKNGVFYQFDPEQSYGTPPHSNGMLSRFYFYGPEEELTTEYGTYSIVTERKAEGSTMLGWKKLVNNDNHTCAIQTMDRKDIVPISAQAKKCEYTHGYFIVEDANSLCSVYALDGKCVIPASEGFTTIRYDYGNYLFEVRLRSNDKYYGGLYDANGNVAVAPVKYESISMENKDGNVYYSVKTHDGERSLLDENFNPIISVPDKYLIYLYDDNLGRYYTIYDMTLDDHREGLMDETGEIIIHPGKYDYITRDANFFNAYYRVAKKPGGDWAYGICDLMGNEVLPCEYQYISNGDDGVIQVEKDRQKYTVTTDLSRPTKLDIVYKNGYYYALGSDGKHINSYGYDTMAYQEEKFGYVVSRDGYSTGLSPKGYERNPIINQMFNEAYGLMQTEPSTAFALFNDVAQLDAGDKYTELKSNALTNMGTICYNSNNDPDTAADYFNQALKVNPTNAVALRNLNLILNPPTETKSYSWLDALVDISKGLNSMAQTVSQYENAKRSASSSSSSRSSGRSSKSSAKSGKSSHGQASYSQTRNYSSAYSNYESQLISMKNYPERYSNIAQERRNIQSKMREIREKNNSNPNTPSISKSSWEDWNGN
ncbi:MAG: WG repeat-containing protein [Bacteroidales bacterium]|nr:WG repeat-containing protein [Bacteroidales bacterium]